MSGMLRLLLSWSPLRFTRSRAYRFGANRCERGLASAEIAAEGRLGL
jgi:hypothetical protein